MNQLEVSLVCNVINFITTKDEISLKEIIEKFDVNDNVATLLIEKLEEMKLVSLNEGSDTRKVLIKNSNKELNSNLILKRFNYEDMDIQYEFVCDIMSENGYQNDYFGMTREEFEPMFEKRENHRKGINLPNGFVADSQYFLYDDGDIVAVFNLRHTLNDFLRTGPGHIGYCVKDEYQGNGYATLGLHLAIKELVSMDTFDEEEVYISCNISNLASFKAQINNNAILVDINNDNFLTRVKVK